MDILKREISTLYEAFSNGSPTPALAELPIQYADFSVWQRNVMRGELLEALAVILEETAGGRFACARPAD